MAQRDWAPRWQRHEDLQLLGWPAWAQLGVHAVISSRIGGVSRGAVAGLNLGLHVGDDPAAVHANRQALGAALGRPVNHWVFGQQVHGAAVAVVTAADAGRGATPDGPAAVSAVDALVTTHDVVLGVLVADCAPVLIVDPVARVLAVAHAGWRGTVADVCGATVAQMRECGAVPARCHALIGPCVQPQRYQVDQPVLQAVRARFGASASARVLTAHPSGGHGFDLPAANRELLHAAGVPSAQVQLSGFGTGPDTPFYSHRQEGPCGRFALLATLSPPEEVS